MNTENNIQQLLQEYYNLEEKYNNAKDEHNAINDEINKLYGDRIDKCKKTISELKCALDNVRQELETIASRYYESTGDKHPHENVTVVVRKVPRYDTNDAIKWCADKNLYHLLKLNVSAFNKLANATHVDCVSIENEISVRIDKNK